MSDRTFAATTGSGNAGTVICSRPWYCETLVTSPSAPPRLVHVSFESSGAARTGARPPQINSYSVPARLFPQRATCGQRIGNADGGGVLCQSVLTIPDEVSWNAIRPWACGAPAGFSSPCVVHSSRNALAFCSLTVTFSLVGVGL